MRASIWLAALSAISCGSPSPSATHIACPTSPKLPTLTAEGAPSGERVCVSAGDRAPQPSAPTRDAYLLLAPPGLRARRVLRLARRLSRDGSAVRLAVSAGGREAALPPFVSDVARPSALDVHLWLVLDGGQLLVRDSEGASVPVEGDDVWRSLSARLAAQRDMWPRRRRLAFELGPEADVRTWARAIQVAAEAGFDQPWLIAPRRLESVAPLPDLSRVGLSGLAPPSSALPERPTSYEDRAPAFEAEVIIDRIELFGELEGVREAISRRLAALADCHARAPAPPDAGSLVVQLLLQPTGVQSVLSGRSTLDHPDMEQCVRASLSRLELSARELSGVEITLSFRRRWNRADGL